MFVPVFTLTEIFVFSAEPRFVVINITPLAPLLPYIAVAAASLRIVVDSISLGFIAFKLPLYGKPSTTYKGELLPLIDPILPRTLTVEEVPG